MPRPDCSQTAPSLREEMSERDIVKKRPRWVKKAQIQGANPREHPKQFDQKTERNLHMERSHGDSVHRRKKQIGAGSREFEAYLTNSTGTFRNLLFSFWNVDRFMFVSAERTKARRIKGYLLLEIPLISFRIWKKREVVRRRINRKQSKCSVARPNLRFLLFVL